MKGLQEAVVVVLWVADDIEDDGDGDGDGGDGMKMTMMMMTMTISGGLFRQLLGWKVGKELL